MEGFYRAASRAISYCPSFSPTPLLLSEASLFPLRVTLTLFALSSYERALHLPTPFPLSGLARLGMKPRYSSDTPGKFLRPLTRLCFLILGRLALLALPCVLGICLPSLWSLSFPLYAPALIPLPRQGVVLAYLDSLSHLTIWWLKQMALLRFFLTKAALAYLPTVLPVALPPFLPRNDTAYVLARLGALYVPSANPCSLSPLISRIHSSLFSDWRRTVSSKFFNPQVPLISTEELVLPRHARCVLSRFRCNGHSLLLSSYLSRIGRIKNLSCNAC